MGFSIQIDPAEARRLFDSIDTMTPAGLRDRALISFMAYSFVRIGEALRMKVEDVFTQVPLRETFRFTVHNYASAKSLLRRTVQ